MTAKSVADTTGSTTTTCGKAMTPHKKAVEAAEQAGDATLFDDNTHWSAHYTAAISTYLASMEAQGWVMVPREPTEVMLEAGRAENVGPHSMRPSYIYRAMLAAKEG